jgi:hypothetical protein
MTCGFITAHSHHVHLCVKNEERKNVTKTEQTVGDEDDMLLIGTSFDIT